MSTTYVSVLCLSVLVAFASAQGYGNTIMISSEMPYVVSDVVAGGGLSVTWPGSRLINVVPSNGLQVQRIVHGGVRPIITQGGGIPLTVTSGMPNVMSGNGIPVLGGIPSTMWYKGTDPRTVNQETTTSSSSTAPIITQGGGIPLTVTRGMPNVMSGNGIPVFEGMPSSMPQVITGTGIQRIMPGVGMPRMMPGVGMPRMMPGMGMPFMTGDMMDVFKDYYQTVGMINMLGLGQPVQMNGQQYPAQRRAIRYTGTDPRMLNHKTTSSSPSTAPVVKTIAIQRQTDLKTSKATASPTTKP